MIKNRILKIRTKRNLKKNKKERRSISFELVKQVGVLFSVDTLEKHQIINKLVQNFRNENIKVTVLVYLQKNKTNHQFLYDYFTNIDFSLFGSIKSNILKKFIKTPFDYLLFIDFSNSIYMENILSLSKANFRVAPYHLSNIKYSEMMVKIDQTSNLDLLVKEMYKYVKLLS